MDKITQKKSFSDRKKKINICSGSLSGRSVKFTKGGVGVCGYAQRGEEEPIGGCMPSPCALGCSFDRELMRDIGEAVGEAASALGFNAVLSPDLNVVRSPLYGSSADRFGEDPYLCGSLGAEWVKGLQSANVAAVAGELAGPHQNSGKYVGNSVIDARALDEIYLRPFEMVVKLARPRAVYCGFNRVNGLECCDNPTLLTEILRRRWKYEGVVLSDARLSADSSASFAGGVDMSVEDGGFRVRRSLSSGISRGDVPKHYLDKSAERALAMTEFEQPPTAYNYDRDKYHALERRAAEQCAVLLKNYKSTLPLPMSGSIALIGRGAKFPRIQRGGRNAVSARGIHGMPWVFDKNQIRYKYCDGYMDEGDYDQYVAEELLNRAVKCASDAEYALVFVGAGDYSDNSCSDFSSCRLSKRQVKLINAVSKVNPNTIVVVNSSVLPKMKWINRVKAVIFMPLCGEEMCEALFNLIFGAANPCGRLAVSSPAHESDIASRECFGAESGENVEFRESIYVGYRYYITAGAEMAFPFGYGLSYTRFEYSAMKASGREGGYEISLRVKNAGRRNGAEVVQIYVEAPKSGSFRAVRELKQFEKVFLLMGEEKTVRCFLPDEAFEFYDCARSKRSVISGRYRICVGASCTDIRLEEYVWVDGEQPKSPEPSKPLSSRDNAALAWYFAPNGLPKAANFAALSERRRETANAAKISPKDVKYSVECNLNQLSDIGIFAFAVKMIKRILFSVLPVEDVKAPEYAEREDFLLNMPVVRLQGLCHGLYPMKLTRLAIWLANRRAVKGQKPANKSKGR